MLLQACTLDGLVSLSIVEEGQSWVPKVDTMRNKRITVVDESETCDILLGCMFLSSMWHSFASIYYVQQQYIYF